MKKIKMFTLIVVIIMLIIVITLMVMKKTEKTDKVITSKNTEETTVISDEAGTKGRCGDDATYSYDEKTETLIIDGTGPMWDNIDFANNVDYVRYIKIKKGITVIGKKAFYYLDGVEKVEIANTVYAIKEYAFGYIHGTITIPASVNIVESDAINGADKIVIKGDMKNYGYAAFLGPVHHVEIGGTAEMLGYALALADGDNEEVVETGKRVNVTLTKTNKKCKIVNHCLMSKNGKKLYYYIENGEERDNIVIPDMVKVISPFAFVYASVKEVKLGKDVRTIGEYAFYDAVLYKVIMNKKLKTIRSGAFNGDYLEKVMLKSNVNMERNAFSYMTKIHTTKNFKKAKTAISFATVGRDETSIYFSKVAGTQGYQVKIQRENKIFTYTTKKNEHSIKNPMILQNYYAKGNYELWEYKKKISGNPAYVTVRPYKVLKNKKKVYGKWSSKTILGIEY